MSNIPVIPKVAEDTNYPAGIDPWSGTPTKLTVPAAYESVGWVPGQPIAATYENKHKNDVCTVLSDAQMRAVLKSVRGGKLTGTTGLPEWMPITKVLMIDRDTGGTPKVAAMSPDMSHENKTATTDGSFNISSAYYSSGTTGAMLRWDGAAIGSSGSIQRVLDSKARTVASITPPTLNTIYTAGCQDIGTGNAIIVASLNSGTPVYGIAYGNPIAGLTWSAFGAGWTSAYAWAVSKPADINGLAVTMVFGRDSTNMVEISTGGASIGSVTPMVWSPFGSISGSMMEPTYDVANLRWVCCTADMTTDGDTASGSCYVWRSTDGVTWHIITASLDTVFYNIKYHRGWLWVIGRPINHTGRPSHDGLEIYVSKDGGATWVRPGIVLTMVADSYPGITTTKITLCDSHIVFSYLSNPIEYAVIQLDAVQ